MPMSPLGSDKCRRHARLREAIFNYLSSAWTGHVVLMQEGAWWGYGVVFFGTHVSSVQQQNVSAEISTCPNRCAHRDVETTLSPSPLPFLHRSSQCSLSSEAFRDSPTFQKRCPTTSSESIGPAPCRTEAYLSATQLQNKYHLGRYL